MIDVISAIEQRRSINFFEPNLEISDEQLKKIIELASLSPSSFNLQPWKVVVVRTPAKKRILRQYAMNQAKVEEASAVFIIVADPAAVENDIDLIFDKQIEYGYMKAEMKESVKQTAKNFYGSISSINRTIFAIKNATLFAMTLMIAAKGLGYDTHAIEGIDPDKIKKEFNIEQDKLIPMIIAIGYPKQNMILLPRPYRKPVEQIVRFE